MGLPRYIVNLEELAEAILRGYSQTDEMTSKAQRSKGLMINSNPFKTQEAIWIPKEGIGITGIRFSQEDVRNLGYNDYFNIYINEEELVSGVHCKEVGEYKPFRSFYLVPEGSKVIIEYHNNSGIKKEVKFDIDYVSEKMPNKEIFIICRDINTGDTIKTFTLFVPCSSVTMVSPSHIEGYVPISSPIEVSFPSPYTPSPKIVTFDYEELPPPPPPPPDPMIPHYYDWKFVLRWEGNTSTDMDFRATFNNGNEVYFGNKEWGVEGEEDRVWLDIDYTSHNGTNDREEKPEIITVLGHPSNEIVFSVQNWRDGNSLTKEITVEAYKVEENKEILVKTVSKSADSFQKNKIIVPFMQLDLITNTVQEL